MAMKKSFTIELYPDTVAYLELLGDNIGARPDHVVEDVLKHLAQSAADGVRRPGAWERGWVAQAFGSSFEDKVEPEPERPWSVIPRKKA
jgi:hypothetical protein